MKNKFNRKISRAFKFSIAMLVICSGISLFTFKSAGNKETWVQHTHYVIQRLEFLISVMKDAETGARGYIITKQKNTLAPYTHAETVSLKTLNDIKQLTQDNPEQQASIRLLRLNIDTQ